MVTVTLQVCLSDLKYAFKKPESSQCLWRWFIITICLHNPLYLQATLLISKRIHITQIQLKPRHDCSTTTGNQWAVHCFQTCPTLPSGMPDSLTPTIWVTVTWNKLDPEVGRFQGSLVTVFLDKQATVKRPNPPPPMYKCHPGLASQPGYLSEERLQFKLSVILTGFYSHASFSNKRTTKQIEEIQPFLKTNSLGWSHDALMRCHSRAVLHNPDLGDSWGPMKRKITRGSKRLTWQ